MPEGTATFDKTMVAQLFCEALADAAPLDPENVHDARLARLCAAGAGVMAGPASATGEAWAETTKAARSKRERGNMVNDLVELKLLVAVVVEHVHFDRHVVTILIDKIRRHCLSFNNAKSTALSGIIPGNALSLQSNNHVSMRQLIQLRGSWLQGSTYVRTREYSVRRTD